jgi:D-proline reductase (dithiol) PrdB
VADFHYSFMGATDPMKMEPMARNLGVLLRKDQINGILLVPV